MLEFETSSGRHVEMPESHWIDITNLPRNQLDIKSIDFPITTYIPPTHDIPARSQNIATNTSNKNHGSVEVNATPELESDLQNALGDSLPSPGNKSYEIDVSEVLHDNQVLSQTRVPVQRIPIVLLFEQAGDSSRVSSVNASSTNLPLSPQEESTVDGNKKSVGEKLRWMVLYLALDLSDGQDVNVRVLKRFVGGGASEEMFECCEIFGFNDSHFAQDVEEDDEATQQQPSGSRKEQHPECVICLTDSKDTIVLPCRHMCLCHECGEVLRQRDSKCPICRQMFHSLLVLSVKQQPQLATPTLM